ncbi:MAG TPA: GNAT family N-acetyltransferase [Micromonosporaceae bacterium]
MRIRRAVIEDAPTIAGVQVRSWQQAYAEVLPADHLAALDVVGRTAMWQRVIEQGGGVFVADRDGEVAGFVAAGRFRPAEGDDVEPGVGEVYAIYVDPARWSAGAGRALMDAAAEHLTDAGFDEIRLWVFEHNPRARRFYERCGFTLDRGPVAFMEGETEVTEVRYARSTS